MGTGAFEVLFKLKGHQKIILVDGVINTGEKAGTLYKVPAKEVMSAPQDDPMVFFTQYKVGSSVKLCQENTAGSVSRRYYCLFNCHRQY